MLESCFKHLTKGIFPSPSPPCREGKAFMVEVCGYCSHAPAGAAHNCHGNPSFPWKTEGNHWHTAAFNSLLHRWDTPGYQDALCKGTAPIIPSLGSWLLTRGNPGWGRREIWDRLDRGRGRSSCSCPEQTQPTVLAKAMEEAVWLLIIAVPRCCVAQSGGKEPKRNNEGHKIVTWKAEVPVQGCEKGRTEQSSAERLCGHWLEKCFGGRRSTLSLNVIMGL